jgi:hypothetical protein
VLPLVGLVGLVGIAGLVSSGDAAAQAPAGLAEDSACGSVLDASQRQLLTAGGHGLAYAVQPHPLVVGRHFALDIVVCPRPRPGLAAPVALRVDADMPAHRHGMNYRPTVRALGAGRYRAEGLMLHMPGRWRLLFELSVDGRIERLSHDIDLE